MASPILRLSMFETVPKGVWAALPKTRQAFLSPAILNLVSSTLYGLVRSTV